MNEYLFLQINSLAGQNLWLDRFMIFSAEWLGYFMILLLITPLLLTLFIRNDRVSAWARYALLEWSYYKAMLVVSFVSAFVSRFIFVTVIRYFYYSARPFEALEKLNSLVAHEATSSFPSGHASFYFAIATGVYLYNKKLGYIYLALVGLMGFARIFAGVHWPFDILAGAVLGIVMAILTKLFFDKKRALWGSSMSA